MHKNTVFQLDQFYNTAQLAPRSLEALATHCLIIWMQGSHHHRAPKKKKKPIGLT